MSKKTTVFVWIMLILSVLIGVGLLIILARAFIAKPATPTTKDVVQELVDAPEPQEIRLLFLGDIMLDRTIRKDGEAQGYDALFSCLAESFRGYDEVIGNLEGTVTNFTSVSRDAAYESPASFRFTFDVRAVEALRDLGLSVVSLANNHIRDFGEEGISQTVSNLDELDIISFGDPRKDAQRYVVHEIKGTKFALIPYNEFFGTKEQTLADIAEAAPLSDVQIVFPHWGDEYVPVRADVRQLAHAFVDAGADLIIGGHPHVIQETEKYKDVQIYYSLGNFIFDQYWEEAVREGLMVSMTFKEGKVIASENIKVESARRAGTCPQG